MQASNRCAIGVHKHALIVGRVVGDPLPVRRPPRRKSLCQLSHVPRRNVDDGDHRVLLSTLESMHDCHSSDG